MKKQLKVYKVKWKTPLGDKEGIDFITAESRDVATDIVKKERPVCRVKRAVVVHHLPST